MHFSFFNSRMRAPFFMTRIGVFARALRKYIMIVYPEVSKVVMYLFCL